MFSVLPDLVPEGAEGNLTTTGLEREDGELQVQGEEHAPACSRVNSKKFKLSTLNPGAKLFNPVRLDEYALASVDGNSVNNFPRATSTPSPTNIVIALSPSVPSSTSPTETVTKAKTQAQALCNLTLPLFTFPAN